MKKNRLYHFRNDDRANRRRESKVARSSGEITKNGCAHRVRDVLFRFHRLAPENARAACCNPWLCNCSSPRYRQSSVVLWWLSMWLNPSRVRFFSLPQATFSTGMRVAWMSIYRATQKRDSIIRYLASFENLFIGSHFRIRYRNCNL